MVLFLVIQIHQADTIMISMKIDGSLKQFFPIRSLSKIGTARFQLILSSLHHQELKGHTALQRIQEYEGRCIFFLLSMFLVFRRSKTSSQKKKNLCFPRHSVFHNQVNCCTLMVCPNKYLYACLLVKRLPTYSSIHPFVDQLWAELKAFPLEEQAAGAWE